MAALRVVPFGQPVKPEYLIDLGPCRARLSQHAYISMGSAIEDRIVRRETPPRPPAPRKPRDIVRCGKWMPILGEPCARRVGHVVGDCRSAASVEHDRVRRMKPAP